MLRVELEQLVSSVRFSNGRLSGDELAVLIVRQMQAVMANQLNIVCAPGYETFGSNKQCKAPRSKNFGNIKTFSNKLFQDYNFAPVSNVQPTCSGSNGGWWEPRPTQRPTYTTRPTQRPTYAPIRTIPPRTEAPEPATWPATEPAATTAAPDTFAPITDRNGFISFLYA